MVDDPPEDPEEDPEEVEESARPKLTVLRGGVSDKPRQPPAGYLTRTGDYYGYKAGQNIVCKISCRERGGYAEGRVLLSPIFQENRSPDQDT